MVMEMLVHPEAGRGGRVSVRGLLCARHQQQGEAGTARWQREDTQKEVGTGSELQSAPPLSGKPEEGLYEKKERGAPGANGLLTDTILPSEGMKAGRLLILSLVCRVLKLISSWHFSCTLGGLCFRR